MLSQIFTSVISIFTAFFNCLKSFEFDNGITLFSVFLFLIFARIVIFLISFIKDVVHTERDDNQ